MKVLVLNCGSSSVKFQLLDVDPKDAVVPTNEELLIARDTARIVVGLPAE